MENQKNNKSYNNQIHDYKYEMNIKKFNTKKRSLSVPLHSNKHFKQQSTYDFLNHSHYLNDNVNSNQHKEHHEKKHYYHDLKYEGYPHFRQEKYMQHKAPLSSGDQYRKKIAEENRRIVRRNLELIDLIGVKTIGIYYTITIPKHINRKCPIRIFDCSTINAVIISHNAHPGCKICALNFANSIKPGGGYLNGRNAQEECLCRQTFLYPTLVGNSMYRINKRNGSKPEASDIMIYSPNVMVIRDDDYNMIRPFPIDIISSPAVDNRNKNIRKVDKIMLKRIKKIIKVAASEKVEILVLGAFGCGVFKNDPKMIAKSFYHVLVEKNYKKYFRLVLFPIYKNQYLYDIFNLILGNESA